MATYKIKSGDTLTAIAKRYGTTVTALAKANGIKNPNLIYAGASLTVPGSSKPASKPAAPKPAAPKPVAPPPPDPNTELLKQIQEQQKAQLELQNQQWATQQQQMAQQQAQQNQQREDAYQMLTSMFSQYGLDSLAPKIREFLT